MKKLHKLLLKSFFGPFLIAFSVILFVLVLQFLSKYLEDIVGKDIGTDILGEVFVYACLSLVTLALPLAILLSSLLTMGNLGERYELAAIRSSGIGLIRIMKPLTFITLVVTGCSLYFAFYINPIASLKLYTILFDLSNVKPTFAIKEDHFYAGIDGLVIHVDEIDRQSDMLYGIKVYDHSRNVGNHQITLADKGFMKPSPDKGFLKITLFDGVVHSGDKASASTSQKEPYQRFYFDTLKYEVPLSGFNLEESNERTLNNHHYMLNIVELYQTADSITGKLPKHAVDMNDYINRFVHVDTTLSQEARVAMEASDVPEERKGIIHASEDKEILDWFPELTKVQILEKAGQSALSVRNYTRIVKGRLNTDIEKRRKYEIEIHYRYMLPVSCIVFLFLGAPLGAIIRKGGIGMPVLVSILFFILFYILMIQGRKLARDGHMEVWLGVWLPVLVIFPMAVIFTYQSQTDSPLLYNHNWYKVQKILLFWLPKRKKSGPDRSTMSIQELIDLRERQKRDARQAIDDYQDSKKPKSKEHE